jgi:hypothetical protein
MRTVVTLSLAALALLVAMTGTVFASTGAAEVGIVDLLEPVYRAIVGGQYWAAAALALVAAVALARRYGVKYLPFLGTDAGGTLLLFVGSFAGALGTALLAMGTAGPSLAMVKAAFWIAFAAGGGYTAVKRLVVPVFVYLETVSPAWLRPLWALVVAVLGKVTGAPSAKTVAEAEKVGEDAVKADPDKGAAGVIGSPRDVL